MAVEVQWDGVPEFDRVVLDRMAEVRDAAHDFVRQGLHVMESAIKRRSGEGGRHRRGTRTPARQGGGPAVITGTLRRSITVGTISSRGVVGFEGEVGPTTVYGRRVELEYNYPYVRTGVDDSIPRLTALMGRLWRRALGG